jgi:hypothetical protein
MENAMTNGMNQKKLYVWRLARFLRSHGMIMSASELAEHLNRNEFLTAYKTQFAGGRGTYRLIKTTYDWVAVDLGLVDEADYIAKAFVDGKGNYAYLSAD